MIQMVNKMALLVGAPHLDPPLDKDPKIVKHVII
jgi:hypothetical protein